MVTARTLWRELVLDVAVIVLLAGVGGAVGYEAAMPDVLDSSNASPPAEGVGLWFGVILGAAAGVTIVAVWRSFASASIAVALAAAVAVLVYGATIGESLRDTAEFGLYVVPLSTVAACAIGLLTALVCIGVVAAVRRIATHNRTR
jgi:hypothetical protein